MTFLNIPTQPLLEIPAHLHLTAWHNRSSSTPAWWNTYLNQVCLQTVLPWLQTELGAIAPSRLDHHDLQTRWQLVTGTALNLESYRVILIPDKSLDTSELRVPQEWIDLPSWAGDYYLAVQVNPDEATILIWGYTTREQIKTQGKYDAHDRAYCLDAQFLIQDWAVFAVARNVCPQEVSRAAIASPPPVSATQAETLLQRLANLEILHPRLEIPFQLWGALLQQPQWRQRLGQLRFKQASPKSGVQLSQWLQNTFDQSWQSLTSLLGSQPVLDYRFRQIDHRAVQRVKVLDLEKQTVCLFVSLEVPDNADRETIFAEADLKEISTSADRIAVRVHLCSAERNSVLPIGLTLTLLSESGAVVQSIVARDRDDVIQLKRFRCPIGTQFSLQIGLEPICLTENFSI